MAAANQIDINCPVGVRAGDSIVVVVRTDNPNATVSHTLSGIYTTSTQSESGRNIVVDTTPVEDGGAVGDVIFYITCSDESGETTYVCLVHVVDNTLDYIVDESEPWCPTFRYCRTVCETATATVVVDDCEPTSGEVYFTFNAKDAPATPEKPPATALEARPLIGVKAVAYNDGDSDLIYCDCEEEYSINCEPHRPNFIWNSVCGCPDWTVTGGGIDGTTAADACGCSTGKPWTFSGSGTFSASGSPHFVDVAVIWGHNLLSGTVVTDPPAYTDPPGGAFDIGLCQDDACVGGFTRPLVIPLDNRNAPDGVHIVSSVSAQISGTTVDGGPIKISYMTFGQRLFLPDDVLDAGFVNPFTGTDCEFDIKESECGILSRTMRRVMKSWSISIEDAPESWVQNTWRAYMRYLCAGHPVLFQWSRNRAENDLFYGFLDGVQPGSTYDTETGAQTVTANFRGYCSQPQQKRVG